ncbi:hypothetical protein EZ428_13750 [Pedobacter frigiditerrae]|uniref:DUF4153 domain-containing protein n=1 Tax=Pedobacter frigiditerrae TaxID=2530452 RepID=A0A4V2MIG9_9SPHI|nr:hypothetical protein [Pedobacter frigiditerrae]TCC90336.1 hypothetical protein EZ428_13750 [Pedobacter frigiditerrae]
MENEIRNHLNNPTELEALYRNNKVRFKRSFDVLYTEFKGNAIADCWKERLHYESPELNWGSRSELLYVVVASLIAGLVAKLPAIFNINEDYFYPRNIGFIVFPMLTIFFAWKNKLSVAKIAFIAVTTLIGLIFINSLPNVKQSDTLILSCIHLGLFLWSILGIAFVGEQTNDKQQRLAFLKYNGDLVVMTTLILIAGGIMSAITVNLFGLIGLEIADTYFQYVGVFGISAAPMVGTYLVQTNPQLVGKVSPVIAKIFSPLVLVMLVVYLIAIVYAGKNPYNDREFLLIFNALLIGVLAIIFFSIVETAKATKNTTAVWILLLLATVTVIVNGVALSAIVFRIAEMGITPNRAAVLGSNVLILINLLLVTTKLFKVLAKKVEIDDVGKTIASYLPIYFIWTIIVTFIFPLIFGFK